MEKINWNKCIKCGGIGKPSKAFGDAYGEEDISGKRTVHEGRGWLVDCLKCGQCGHSWKPGTVQTMETFILIAHRNGNSEEHSYPVAVIDDLEAAKQFADEHCAFRGGKYAVAVCYMYPRGKPDDVDFFKPVYLAKSRQCLWKEQLAEKQKEIAARRPVKTFQTGKPPGIVNTLKKDLKPPVKSNK